MNHFKRHRTLKMLLISLEISERESEKKIMKLQKLSKIHPFFKLSRKQ